MTTLCRLCVMPSFLTLCASAWACGGIVDVSQSGTATFEPDSAEPDSAEPEALSVELHWPTESPYGATYSEWLARYWQWHLSLPRQGHPREGGDCRLGQWGDVWFLTTGHSGQVEWRECAIPQGVSVYFVLHSLLLMPRPDCGSSCLASEESPAAWYDALADNLEQAAARIAGSSLLLELEGAQRDIGDDYFWQTNEPFFSDTVADDPYFPCAGPISRGVCGWAAEEPRPFAALAYAVMLRPLPRGEHLIRFGASNEQRDWSTDVNYLLTVE